MRRAHQRILQLITLSLVYGVVCGVYVWHACLCNAMHDIYGTAGFEQLNGIILYYVA